MKFTREEKVDTLLITISAISVITSFVLSLDNIAWIAVAVCGIPIFRNCWEGLKEFDIKADLLVSIAIIASVIIGEVMAAGEIATIMAIGGFLEEYTVKKTQGKIKELAKMTPQYATRIRKNSEEKIPVDKIKAGDELKVLPGESVPADGIIMRGRTTVDQSALTGESLPVDKKANDKVYSGSVNLYGSFTMKATKASKDSSLEKLIQLVETSKPENAEIVRAADRWATAIVVIAFSAAVLTYLFTFDIMRSVTILVVFCPCALVLATPTAIMAAIGNLTKYGILVKDGSSIEELAHIDELIFDKTGTLTCGTPEVVSVVSDNKKEMLYLVCSLESHSQHPLAKAIVKYYGRDDYAHVDDFKIHAGEGVSGTVNGARILAGNEKLMETEKISINHRPENGEITVFVAKDGKLMGRIILKDTLRRTSGETIRKLKILRVRTTLLTGDSEETGNYIAKQAKVRNVRGNCLPEDKTEYIKGEQIKGNKVAMIGDGINDAPSLRKANVGIAMGNIGSDVCVEAADIALVNDNIEDIPHLISLSRKTMKTINLNIAFSLAVNIIAMGLAVGGVLNPVEGALIHNIGSVIVIIYSSTLANYRKRRFTAKSFGIKKTFNRQIT